jgi:hypothetical protein
VLIPVPGEGREVVVAFIDPKNAQDTAAGGAKVYARDTAGDVVCSILLKSDGSININGAVNINGVTIDTDGNVTAPPSAKIEAPTVEGTTSLKGAGVEHVGHAHGGVTSGTASTAPIA